MTMTSRVSRLKETTMELPDIDERKLFDEAGKAAHLHRFGSEGTPLGANEMMRRMRELLPKAKARRPKRPKPRHRADAKAEPVCRPQRFDGNAAYRGWRRGEEVRTRRHAWAAARDTRCQWSADDHASGLPILHHGAGRNR